jgi:hypothetical protein
LQFLFFDYVSAGWSSVARRFAIQAEITRRLSAGLAGTSLVRQDQFGRPKKIAV